MTIKTFSVSLNHNGPFPPEINNLLDGGWTILHISPEWNFEDDTHERWILHKPVAKAESISTDDLVLDNIVSIERDVTSNSNSPMWRCVTANGERVNIFKHEDEDKNNFHLFEKKGWADVLLVMPMYEQIDTTDSPVAIAMKKDGKWWAIVSVMQAPSEVGAWFGNQADDESDDITWDSATQDSVDRLQQGISFDDDEPGSIDDYEVPPQADDDPDDMPAKDDEPYSDENPAWSGYANDDDESDDDDVSQTD